MSNLSKSERRKQYDEKIRKKNNVKRKSIPSKKSRPPFKVVRSQIKKKKKKSNETFLDDAQRKSFDSFKKSVKSRENPKTKNQKNDSHSEDDVLKRHSEDDVLKGENDQLKERIVSMKDIFVKKVNIYKDFIVDYLNNRKKDNLNILKFNLDEEEIRQDSFKLNDFYKNHFYRSILLEKTHMELKKRYDDINKVQNEDKMNKFNEDKLGEKMKNIKIQHEKEIRRLKDMFTRCKNEFDANERIDKDKIKELKVSKDEIKEKLRKYEKLVEKERKEAHEKSKNMRMKYEEIVRSKENEMNQKENIYSTKLNDDKQLLQSKINEIGLLKRSIDDVKGEKNKIEMGLFDFQKKNKRLLDNYKKVIDDKGALEKVIKEKNVNIMSLEKSVKELMKLNENYEIEKKKLIEKLRIVSKNCDDLTQDNNDLNVQIDTITKAKERVEVNLKNAIDEKKLIHEKYIELDVNHNSLKEKHTKIEDVYDKMEDSHQKLCEKYNILDDNHRTLVDKYEKLNDLYTTLKDKCIKVVEERNEVKKNGIRLVEILEKSKSCDNVNKLHVLLESETDNLTGIFYNYFKKLVADDMTLIDDQKVVEKTQNKFDYLIFICHMPTTRTVDLKKLDIMVKLSKQAKKTLILVVRKTKTIGLLKLPGIVDWKVSAGTPVFEFALNRKEVLKKVNDKNKELMLKELPDRKLGIEKMMLSRYFSTLKAKEK